VSAEYEAWKLQDRTSEIDFEVACDRTAASGLARARFEFNTGWDPAQWASIADRLPAWMRIIGRAVKPIVKRKVGHVDMSRGVEEGIVDLAGRRSAMCPTHRPLIMVIGSRAWYGRPGQRLEEKESFAADTTNPLWLLALLRGVVEATPAESVVVRGERCRSFAAIADLARASAATPGGLPVCEVPRFEDLSALPLTIALDDEGRVRRVAGAPTFGSIGNSDYVVELFDFGRVEPIDWTRVPNLERPVA
jgi:hypothetical protein